ncbi:MAG: hypothetical protein Q7J35_16245 [Candidatus Methanoperedens sp.]|nr:hypothetical protein [Candidatus Methanoperedens sp.]
MNDFSTSLEEATELPGKDEDVSVHMKELQEYKGGQAGPAEKAWDLSDGMSTHPLFFFIWEEVPGTDNSAFLARLTELLGMDWILDAGIEKSSENTSMIVTKGDELVYFEIYPELSGVVISDREGEPLLELTARDSKGKMYCFSTLICNRKLNGDICFNEAMPGNTKCLKHSNPNIGRKPGQKRLAVTSVTTGIQCLPADAYYFWKQKKPEIAHFIDDLAESFMLKLNWEPSHILMNELRYIAVQMVTRNLMHNKAIEADFKSAIHDPETGKIVAFKAHFLLDKITTFDARIQQKLKDFGLLVPPSRTEDPHRIPIGLELLWTPVKKVNAIDVTARVVRTGKEHEQNEGDKNDD